VFGAGCFSRTPRPPPPELAPSPISSIPAPASASTSLTSESTLPDHAFGGLHALDRRQRQPAALRELALIDT
jgi:hypothetical protein